MRYLIILRISCENSDSTNRTFTAALINTYTNNPKDKKNGERKMREKGYIGKGNFLRIRVIPLLVLFLVFTLMFSVTAFSAGEKKPTNTINTASSNATFTVTNESGQSIGEAAIKPQNLTFSVTNPLPITDATVKIIRDGNTNIHNLTIQGNSASGTYNFSSDGKYQAIIVISDEQTTREGSLSFTIDGSGPEITITGAQNNEISTNAKEISINISDPSGYNVDSVKAIRTDLNGQKHSLGGLDNDNFKQTFEKEGLYNINVVATDKSGNKSEKSLSFTIDNSAPELTGKHDKDSATLTIKDYSLDLSKTTAKLLLNGKETNTNIAFSRKDAFTGEANVNLPKDGKGNTIEGNYQIVWESQDGIGKKANGKLTFTIGTTKPSIGITGVENGGLYNANKSVTITIKNTNRDSNKVTIKRNNQNYNAGSFEVSGSTATLNHTFSADGKYEILVEAVDKSGNSLTKKTTFTIDKKAPSITAYIGQSKRVIKDGEYYNTRFTPRITLNNKDDSILSVTLNGKNVTGRIPVISSEGKHSLQVKARDKAGNVSVLDVSFTLDVTKPTLDISGVVEGYLNEDVQPVITYYDKNLDKKKTSVTLNGQPYESGTVLELEQDYVLEAYIVDLAGNVTEESMTFTIDKTAPIIKFMEPISAQYFNKSIIPELLIEDLSDYEILSMTLNGEPYETGQEIEGEGKHVLYLEIKDKAGNIQTLGVEFTIDKTPPKVKFDGVKKNGVYYEPVYVRIILDDPLDRILRLTVNGELYKGEVTEKDGKKYIKVRATQLGDYEIKAIAVDEAGNETELVIPFSIEEKGALLKFYENKPAFLVSVAGIVALLGAVGALGYRIIKRRKEAKQITDDYFN